MVFVSDTPQERSRDLFVERMSDNFLMDSDSTQAQYFCTGTPNIHIKKKNNYMIHPPCTSANIITESDVSILVEYFTVPSEDFDGELTDESIQ